MESSVTAPVSGHIKRVVVQEGECDVLAVAIALVCYLRCHSSGDSINQGDLVVEIVH